ncbi:MAG: DUF4279 domain-containing protein [Rhodococcus sp. (in: high G+C Gram-positive bacteria)]
MKNELRVSFLICGFSIDPDQLSEKLELTPSRTWRKGDLSNARTGRTYSENSWVLEPKNMDAASMDEQAAELLEQLLPLKDAIRSVDGAESQLTVVVYAREFVPEIHLSASVLAGLASLGCSLDVDLYCHIE